jgi:hypothetical protein
VCASVAARLFSGLQKDFHTEELLQFASQAARLVENVKVDSNYNEALFLSGKK